MAYRIKTAMSEKPVTREEVKAYFDELARKKRHQF